MNYAITVYMYIVLVFHANAKSFEIAKQIIQVYNHFFSWVDNFLGMIS